jgi:rhodanese-related sulfurtransferase
MQELGLSDNRYLTDSWDFTDAKTLVIWCNGPACGQSPRAIEGLLKAGYPADKILYYRGGMQMWQLWGLTTVVPES